MELIETIKIEDGEIYNLEYHNRRCNKSRFELFNKKRPIDLKDYIKNFPKNGLFRCRILYNRDILSVEYIPYTIRESKTFKVVKSNIDYSYKYSNRDELDILKMSNNSYDDIIIERGGLLTDTTIANIAFFDGKEWITPKKPLLEGSLRAKLLDNKILVKKDIKIDSLKHFSHYALMNAMIGFRIQKDVTIYINEKEKICL
jgi:4-amino-4-deoxychorismate lyase